MSNTPSVAPLTAFGAADIATVGGKAANLGELLGAGLPVPGGFVVTTDAYAFVAERAGLDALLSGVGEVPEPAALRQAILDTPMPAEIGEAITRCYAALGDRTPVAVRSSATAEDLPGAAFAGQQDTYLNVVGTDEVVDAIRRCWASLWTDRAVAYRRERRIDADEVRIAVVVQTMIASDVAGVLFTADPVSGARDRILIDAGAGLGEAVVSGRVTPDHYVLDARSRVLEFRPGRGEVVIRPTAGGGVHEDARASDGGPLLSDAELAALAGYARAVDEHYGRPQDMEWAVAEGRIWIVQARPMTAVPPPSVPLGRAQRIQASILTELLPVRPYPMDVSTQVLRGPALMMSQMAHHYGIEGLFDDFLREEDGVAVQILPRAPHPTLRTLTTPFRLVGKARRFRPAEWATDSRQTAFLAEIDALEALDLEGLAWTDLIAVPDRALAAQDYCRDLRIDYLPGSALALIRMVVVTTLLGRRRLLPDLLGGARTRTEDSNRALAGLATRLNADRALRDIVGRDPADAWQEIAGDSRFAGFRTGVEEFLEEYGRRETTSPLLVSEPTLAESPALVLGMVASLAQSGDAPAPSSRSAAALAGILGHPLLRGRGRQARIRRWTRAAQEGVAFREDTHFSFTAALPTLRRSILEIGRRLRDTGILDDAGDVFHLRLEEISGIRDPRDATPEQTARLRDLVAKRAAKRAELSGMPMIDPARVFPNTDMGDALVVGTPAGSGTATGTARIIRGAADFDRLGAGEILVCPYTNPSWTPLFQRAAAVVVDTGSSASHAAIVAREYGLPAVMGTGTGTAAIVDGERITVDGARGRVTRAGEET